MKGITRVFREDEPAGADVSALDRGFLLGDALFETLRVYGGVPFRLREHLQRLARSAGHLRINVPVAIREKIQSVLDAGMKEYGDDIKEGVLRITLSRGLSSAPGLAFDPAASATLAVTYVAFQGAPGAGAALNVVIAESRRNEFAATAGHKTTSFGDSIIEMRRARDFGADDSIFLDTKGHVCEGTASNVFLYDGNAVITPVVECGALPGITRGVVVDLARQKTIKVVERVVEKEELFQAREVFLTSSLREIIAIRSIDGRVVPGGTLVGELISGYGEIVRSETGQ